ncbi:GNAT family N-acetyltransferase [Natronoglycomyces albus]|uniref:GNAT family N-acetyltransferase n=1 Tax=Natronoglycomyces albus TaxID=2811108 RepID=A0A895XMD3_9ACTN|nr:GNAT family N-acetyltransferase [Natronoglycomyces albus]QSB04559.1 GNAT family N-acetyltransferase [Natronoglycomyces albus]
MNDIKVWKAGPDDIDHVTEVVTRAGADEEVSRWLMRGLSEDQIKEYVGLTKDSYIKPALTNDEVLLASDASGDIAGFSIWMAMESNERFHNKAQHLRGATAQPGQTILERLLVVTERSNQHRPSTPHLYLQSIAVAPTHRGQGVGGALLRHRLENADHDHQPVYLEASTRRSKALYERHGFTAMGSVVTLPEGPQLQPMWREPKRI